MTRYESNEIKLGDLALEKSEQISKKLKHISKGKLNKLNKQFPKLAITKSKDYDSCLLIKVPNHSPKFILSSDSSNKYCYEVTYETQDNFVAFVCLGRTASEAIKNLIRHVNSHAYRTETKNA